MQYATERVTTAPKAVSKWANRFIWAAIIQGLAATLITIPIIAPWVKPSASMVIAGGSAGTWFTVGYLTYIMVGVIAVAVTALFYHHFEVDMGKPYTGWANRFAWVHLIGMNVGVAAATWMLMWFGYLGGAAMVAVSSGGLGWTALQVHVNILGPIAEPFGNAYLNPIGWAIVLAAIGVLSGGLGYLISNFRK
jgi:hypothetical protein